MSEIKVVPCPDHEFRYAITIDGQYETDKEGIWCAMMEAEANFKATELHLKTDPTEQAAPPRPPSERKVADIQLEKDVRYLAEAYNIPLGEWPEGHSNAAPAAIEQAAALRKEPELVIDMEKALADSLAMLPKSRRNPEREPQRSEVKPNEAQSQKSAAIEQARPQTPTPEQLKSLCETYPCGCQYEPKLVRAKTCEEHTLPAAAEPAPERTPPQGFVTLKIEDLYAWCDPNSGVKPPLEPCCRFCEQWNFKHGIDCPFGIAIARAVAVPEPAAQQGDCQANCIRHEGCIRQRETRTDNLQPHAKPAPTPSRAELNVKKLANDIMARILIDASLCDSTGTVMWHTKHSIGVFGEIINRHLAEASSLGTKEE